jgi:hypothetical protein
MTLNYICSEMSLNACFTIPVLKRDLLEYILSATNIHKIFCICHNKMILVDMAPDVLSHHSILKIFANI